MTVVLKPPRRIETQRLLLRCPEPADAPAIFDAYTSKPHIPKFMSWLVHTRVDQTRHFLDSCVAGWSNGSNFEYVIELREQPGRPIGMIGMLALNHGVGFGYVIAQDYWNRGFTGEALSELVDWSLKQQPVFRAQAFCDVENPASARVMEKAGMKYEGVLRKYFVHPNISNEPRDCLMYAKTR